MKRFLNIYFDAYRNYANFSGRTSREEYRIFYIMHAFVCLMPIIFMYIIPLSINMWRVFCVWIFLFVLLTSIPLLAIRARRLHDINMSGWAQFYLPIIPITGYLTLRRYLYTEGDPYENIYGPPSSEF